jgi:hypothetical protein
VFSCTLLYYFCFSWQISISWTRCFAGLWKRDFWISWPTGSIWPVFQNLIQQNNRPFQTVVKWSPQTIFSRIFLRSVRKSTALQCSHLSVYKIFCFCRKSNLYICQCMIQPNKYNVHTVKRKIFLYGIAEVEKRLEKYRRAARSKQHHRGGHL